LQSFINTKPTVVFFGDSITDSHKTKSDLGDGYVSIVGKAFEDRYNIVNSGVSGDTTLDLIKRFDTDVKIYSPNTVFLLVGINDIWNCFKGKFTTEQQLLDNYNWLVEQITNIGSRLIVMHPFLIHTKSLPKAIKDNLAQFYAKLESTIAIIDSFDSKLSGIIPLQYIFDTLTISANPDEFTKDGVHPTKKGSEIIALYASKYLQ